ncbi:MAG TPA: VanZ family protein [Usitatibacteraceae bacterium]|nr:hypothetical protein [Verrucomicrobiales bacterium]HRE13298.1 VanZ family protein [Usitatibacteraceae bacterium]
MWLEFDVAVNVAAYVPLGALACLAFMRRFPVARARWRAVAACAVLSLGFELVQLFITYRVASLFDVVANAAGALAGTLLFAEPLRTLVTFPAAAWRDRLVVGDSWGDTGLMLVVLWLIAQLNPALPFFEAGNIGGGGAPDPGEFAVTAGSVALSVAGFGLFVSVLLKGPGGALRWTLVLLTLALWFKFGSAALMLRTEHMAGWITEGRVAGLVAGLVCFLPLRELGRPLRIYLATVFVLAGALLAKIFGAYSGVEELLRLFAWPHGQLASFATLTRWLHEAWPVLALAWLVALFVRRRHEPIQ